MGCAQSSAGEVATTTSSSADKPSVYAKQTVTGPAESTPVVKASGGSTRPDGKAFVGSDNIKSHAPAVVEPSTKSTAETPILKRNSIPEPASHQVAHGGAAEVAKQAKGRRAAAGTEAVRDQIRKFAAGGTADDQQEVSDSEDEDDDDERGKGWAKPPEITQAICQALKNNFVFRGISDALLQEVVERMHGICFRAGAVLLQQGASPKPDDCMYYLQLGEADVVISGTVDQNAKTINGEEREVVGHTVRIAQKPGWVFGDIALLFNSSRTASVVARTDITVWALDRRTFLQFVMKHAQGARALRFLRKLPLLKGLSDNDLIAAASRMPQRTYQDGDALIKYGERGEELFLIRYGKVRVMRPDGKGGQIEAVVLGRGQFVGERAVINNKLRSADCLAKGAVKVVVMRKRDFMDLDNPLLAWMMDYDAVSACLRSISYVKGMKQEQMEGIMDRFDAREEYKENQEIIKQGEPLDKLCVVKLGEVRLLKDGAQVSDTNFVREAGGFSFFGEEALQTSAYHSPYTVVVASESAHMLSLSKAQLDSFLGVGTGLTTIEAVLGALQKSKVFKGISETDLKKLAAAASERTYNAGDVIVSAASGPCGNVFLVKGGEAVLVSPDVALPGQVDLGGLVERGRLPPGSLFNEEAVSGGDFGVDLKASLVASTPGTVVMAFTRDEVHSAKANGPGMRSRGTLSSRLQNVKFSELEFHRIIGTGQFGLVRLVRNTNGGDVYALKVMHKAPISESKQMEHVINERRILEEASHPFCVQLRGAYQDKLCLYLLQEWVPGGELFHHLDILGAFDEPTAAFFAANVLLSLEFLHSKGIVYRDLKPENLLVDAQGYLKMADFGFAKHVGDDKTFTICGTPDYQAPEVIMRRGTNKAADYWALGVLIYEMLVGDPPFKSDTPGDAWETFRKALSGRFNMPSFISAEAQDIIWKLLQLTPERRLGSGRLGAEEIKRHPFFAAIDWQALEQKKLVAPIRPTIINPLDTSNFDNFDSCDVEPPPIPRAHAEKQPNWDMWEWID